MSSPSQTAKAAGLRSLKEVTRITGTSAQTLINWHRSKRELFDTVVAGCVAKRRARMI
jgi:AcrR family transcriptional regulator